MKKIIMSTAAATLALAPIAVQAQTHTSGNEQTTYSAPAIPGTPAIYLGPFLIAPATPGVSSAERFAAGVGSKYTQTGTSPDNTDTASSTADANKQTFNLSGTVNQDCSFYNGGSAIHTMALNTIGVRTNSDANVSQAFNQVSDITANFNTATAGCNTKNTVTITSGGALLNSSATDYDSDEFTNKIPYTVTASWTGIASGKGAGTPQKLATTLSGASQTVTKTGGAWRSSFDIAINAPAQKLGLVAGGYADQVVITLAAS